MKWKECKEILTANMDKNLVAWREEWPAGVRIRFRQDVGETIPNCTVEINPTMVEITYEMTKNILKDVHLDENINDDWSIY